MLHYRGILSSLGHLQDFKPKAVAARQRGLARPVGRVVVSPAGFASLQHLADLSALPSCTLCCIWLASSTRAFTLSGDCCWLVVWLARLDRAAWAHIDVHLRVVSVRLLAVVATTPSTRAIGALVVLSPVDLISTAHGEKNTTLCLLVLLVFSVAFRRLWVASDGRAVWLHPSRTTRRLYAASPSDAIRRAGVWRLRRCALLVATRGTRSAATVSRCLPLSSSPPHLHLSSSPPPVPRLSSVSVAPRRCLRSLFRSCPRPAPHLCALHR